MLRTQSLPRYLSVNVISAVIKVKHWYPGHITRRDCTVLLLSPVSVLLSLPTKCLCVSMCLCVTVSVFMLCVILRQSPEPCEKSLHHPPVEPCKHHHLPHKHTGTDFAIFHNHLLSCTYSHTLKMLANTENLKLGSRFLFLFLVHCTISNPRQWAKEHS